MLLDINLGSDNGLESITEIKAAWPKAPVIMITGMGYDDTLMRSALEKGASGYVSKSVPPSELLAAITRVLEHPEHHQV